MSISDGFIETNSHPSCVQGRLGGDLLFWKEAKKSSHMFIWESREHKRQHRWRWHPICLSALMVRSETCSTQVVQQQFAGLFQPRGTKTKRKSPLNQCFSLFLRTLSRTPSKQAVSVALRVNSTAQRAIFKIILHRIISVVWLTNFLSEIWSLSNHDDTVGLLAKIKV